jgi:hypothetical protein
MSAATAIVSRSWPVGARTACLSVPRPEPGKPAHFPGGACVIEWTPSPPSKLTPGEWQQYRQGRNAAVAQIAKELGIAVAVLEL